MGGEIGIDNIIGESATFWFSIVCAEGVSKNVEHDLRPESASEMAGDVAMTSLRTLVAEDNEVNQKVLTAILTSAGHRVDIVGSGIEVVSAVIRGSYDLVLMDVQMPERDGVTATRRIHDLDGNLSQIPIIALTDNEKKGEEDTYRAASMNETVSKPIESEKLAAAMQRQSGSEISTGTTNAHSTAPSPERPNADGTALQDDLNRLICKLDADIACTFTSTFSAIP
jgi:CheY-like chemotaxis protein